MIYLLYLAQINLQLSLPKGIHYGHSALESCCVIAK